MRGLANRPWWLWVIGLIAIVTLATITRDRLLTSDSASTAAREGMLETADFTLPIPRGHRALSQTEVVERSKLEASTEKLVAMLEAPDNSGVAVARLKPRSSENAAPRAPTIDECDRSLTQVATIGNFPIVTEATVVELSPDGLGTSCQYTFAVKTRHLTQIATSEWVLSCMHAPGKDAVCLHVAAGFRRVKR